MIECCNLFFLDRNLEMENAEKFICGIYSYVVPLRHSSFHIYMENVFYFNFSRIKCFIFVPSYAEMLCKIYFHRNFKNNHVF